MRDTIVEEVRKIRDEYARGFNYDLHAMCADLRREQELSGAKSYRLRKGRARIGRPDKAPTMTPGSPAIREPFSQPTATPNDTP